MPPAQLADDLNLLRDGLKYIPTPEESRLSKLTRGAYDKLHPLKDLERQTGIPTYMLGRVVPGSQAAGEAIVQRYVRPALDKVGDDIKHLEEYMVAWRMVDARARTPTARLAGRVVDPEHALDQLAAELGPERTARIRQAAQDLWKMNDDYVLKPLLDEGLISQEHYDAVKAKHPHYIPFLRQDFAQDVEIQTATGRKIASIGERILKDASDEGSYRNLDDPLVHFQAQAIRAQTQIARNRAAKALAKALQAAQDMTGETMIKRGRAGSTATEGSINWYENGERQVAQVPTIYAKVAKGLDAQTAGVAGRILLKAAEPLRMGAVGLNPSFILANVIRDSISAWMYEGIVPFSRTYVSGLLSVLSKDEDWFKATQAGVMMSGITETARHTDELRSVRRLGGIKVNNVGDAFLAVPRFILKFNEIAEQVPRVATFKKLRAQGIDDLEAAVRSRDVTVDFAKSGEAIKVFNQAIPFLNANIQGLANTARLIRTKPGVAALRMAPLATGAILLYLWNKRFETNDQIPRYERKNNFVWQVGEGTDERTGAKFPIYIKIPKGPIAGPMLAPVEVGLDYLFDRDDRSIVEIALGVVADTAVAALPIEPSATGFAPPLLGTAIQMQMNRDAYREQNIIPEQELKLPASQQWGPETSTTAIGIGELAQPVSEVASALGLKYGVSPRMIDFAIRDYTGGAGQTVVWLADVALNALGYNPKTKMVKTDHGLAPAQKLSQAPVIGRFVGTKGNIYEQNKGLQNQFARAQYGRDWDQLSRWEKFRLEQARPELQEAQAIISEYALSRDSVVAQFWADVEHQREGTQSQIEALTKQLEGGQISGNEYRDQLHEMERRMAEFPRELRDTTKYREVPLTAEERAKYYRKAQQPSTHPVDMFLDEYYGMTAQFTDPETGVADVEGLMNAREKLRDKFDAATIRDALLYINRNRDPRYVQAQQLYRQYQAIPKYRGLSQEQAKLADQGAARYSAMRRANPTWPAAKTQAIFRQKYPQEYRAMLTARKRRNPDRQKFWAANPMLGLFYSDLTLDDFSLVQPGAEDLLWMP